MGRCIFVVHATAHHAGRGPHLGIDISIGQPPGVINDLRCLDRHAVGRGVGAIDVPMDRRGAVLPEPTGYLGGEVVVGEGLRVGVCTVRCDDLPHDSDALGCPASYDRVDTEEQDRRFIRQLQGLVMTALVKRRNQRRTGEPPRITRALALARLFNINPQARQECSRKRAIRKIIYALRAAGEPICSNDKGYYLATEASDWAEYNTWRQRQGLSHLAAASAAKRSPGAAETAGQLSMFDTAKSFDNVAIAH